MWDPAAYLRHAGDRGRPFADLLAQVAATDPRLVVDLGCGPGTLTADLVRRWPAARVVGVDSSPQMLAAPEADAAREAGVELVEADLTTYVPDGPVDVLLTNAALQWVPDHLERLPGLVGMLAPGGTFAMQVPANFGAPSHVLMRDLAGSPRWRDRLGGLPWPASHEPGDYLAVLVGDGRRVRVWETTYYQLLPGEDAVLGWVRSTGLRPVLAALDGADRQEYVAEYRQALRAAYPRGPYGTVLPYRRVFAVVDLIP